MKTTLNRIVCCLLIGAASLFSLSAKSDEPDTFIIVHGATAGGWEWKAAGQCLADDGNIVYRATLTGLGERMHLANAEVDLDTHINDVVNLILFEDLHDIVLAGHSYGGTVITGVMNRIPDRIRHVIYLDAMVPEDGESAFDVVGGTPPPNSKVVDGLVYFPWYNPDAPFPHTVPHPIKTFSQSVHYDNPEAFKLPVTYIAFVPEDQSAEERAAKDKSWKRAIQRGWTIRTFPGHHVAHVENPRGVADIIEASVNDVNQ